MEFTGEPDKADNVQRFWRRTRGRGGGYGAQVPFSPKKKNSFKRVITCSRIFTGDLFL